MWRSLHPRAPAVISLEADFGILLEDDFRKAHN